VQDFCLQGIEKTDKLKTEFDKNNFGEEL